MIVEIDDVRGHVPDVGSRAKMLVLLSTAIVLLMPPAVGGTSTNDGGAEQVWEKFSHVQVDWHER